MTTRITIDSTDRWASMPNYDQIVATFGRVLVETSDGDYQGDSLYLITDETRFGILTFGWGSCSGCDALEACSSQSDLDSLQDDLEKSIVWFDNHADARAHLDGEGIKSSYLNDRLVSDFKKALDALTETVTDA